MMRKQIEAGFLLFRSENLQMQLNCDCDTKLICCGSRMMFTAALMQIYLLCSMKIDIFHKRKE